MKESVYFKSLFYICLFFVGATLAQAQQNINFYLEPSGDFLIGSEQSSSETLESSFTNLSSFSSDSAYQIRISNTFVSEKISKVEQSFGGGLRGMMAIPLSSRLSVRTGLGLRYEKYKIDENADFSFTQLSSSTDTIGKIAFSQPTGGGVIPANCITIYEGFTDFEDQLNFIPTYSNLLLEVPLSLRYELLPNKLGITIGATVVTPIRSTYELVNRRFNVPDHPNAPEGVCATVISLETNATGDRISDFQLAGELSADMVLTDRLRVVATASQMFRDRFIQEEETIFLGSGFSGSYRPLRLSLGVQWKLGEGGAPVKD